MGAFCLCYNLNMPELIIPDDLSLSQKEHELAFAVAHLIQKSQKLGITNNTVLEGNEGNMFRANKTIIELAVEAYKVWVSLFPHEHKEFIENAKLDLDTERSVKDSIKAGGIFSVSYPTRFNQLMHVLMPSVKIQDKRFYKPLLQSIPELRRSNYA